MNRNTPGNPAHQSLHDCSMCFSAYIQSLNTVCGTACRLAQCLAQVSPKSEESDGESQQLSQTLKEVADTWESIARLVGVASTSIKAQIMMMIQETQNRQNLDPHLRKTESIKMLQALLTTFLNLHCQFSLLALEKIPAIFCSNEDYQHCPANVQTGVQSKNEQQIFNINSPHKQNISQPVPQHNMSQPPPQPNVPQSFPQQISQANVGMPPPNYITQQLLQQHAIAIQQQQILNHILQLNSANQQNQASHYPINTSAQPNQASNFPLNTSSQPSQGSSNYPLNSSSQSCPGPNYPLNPPNVSNQIPNFQPANANNLSGGQNMASGNLPHPNSVSINPFEASFSGKDLPISGAAGNSRYPSGGSPQVPPISTPQWSPSLNSSFDSFSSHTTHGSILHTALNPLSLLGVDCSSESIFRRWSMGVAEEARLGGLSSLANLFSPANIRRWSVPDTYEKGHKSWSMHSGLWDHRSLGPSPGFSRGRGFARRSFGKDGGGARSPSHSRSVTPDENRRQSLVSNEELNDVIELLSLPFFSSREETGCGQGGIDHFPENVAHFLANQYSTNRPTWKLFGHPNASPIAPDAGPHHDRIPENENESSSTSGGFSSPHSATTTSPTTLETSVSPNEKGSKLQDGNRDSITTKNCKTSNDLRKEMQSQISTSLWPPTANVPGVTLTECIAESDKQNIPPWVELEDSFFIDNSPWAFSAFNNFGYLEDIQPGDLAGGSWPPRHNVTQFRRHSSDAPYSESGIQSPLMPLYLKTRSFENIAKSEDICIGLDPGTKDDFFLPDYPPIPFPQQSVMFTPSSGASDPQYSLFNQCSS